jgi:hypothetical protein
MLGTSSLASRPLAAGPPIPRPFTIAALDGEYGWAAWSYSRQAKLNAWAWHGIGSTSINSWATLGNAIYMRCDSDEYVRIMQPDTFLLADATSSDSTSVEAVTQWLDFGKPGKRKALTGIDFDGLNVQSVEFYVSENGGRTGTLAATIAISENDGGWTYNGEVIPLEEVGSATEFMLRFIGHANLETQINRLTLYYEEVSG